MQVKDRLDGNPDMFKGSEVYISQCIYICIYVYMCVYIYICIYVCVYIYVYVYLSIDIVDDHMRYIYINSIYI